MTDFTHAQARFRELLKQLIAEQGVGRGSKRAVAQATGLDPSHLSRLISDNPPPVGRNLMMAVAGRLEMSPSYFSSPVPVDYRTLKGKVPSQSLFVLTSLSQELFEIKEMLGGIEELLRLVVERRVE